jgi:hypothetical protein
MVLLPVSKRSGEKEAEKDYCYAPAISAYTRSLHDRIRVIRAAERLIERQLHMFGPIVGPELPNPPTVSLAP